MTPEQLVAALDKLFDAEVMPNTPTAWYLVEHGLADPDPEVRDTALSVLSTYVIQDVARERIARHADTELDTRLQEYCTLLLCCGWS